jgi:flagellar biosynthetic protein FliR
MGGWSGIIALLEDGRVGPAMLGAALAAARLFAMMRTLPFLGGRRVPATLHLGLAVALGLALTTAPELASVPPAPLVAVLFIKEILVGFTAGIVASLPFRFIDQAGVIIDAARSTQLSGATGITGSRDSSPTGTLLLLMAMAVFFLTPAHAAFWTSIEATFVAVPIVPLTPAAPSWQGAAFAAIASSAGLFAASVMIALPVLLAVLVTDLAVGAAGRFVPHSGGTFTFMPLRSAVGLGALCLSLTVLAPVMARLLLESMRWLEAIR